MSHAVKFVTMRAQTPVKELKISTATFNRTITISHKFAIEYIKSDSGIALSFFDVLTDDLIEGKSLLNWSHEKSLGTMRALKG